jgi:pre-rRNA-processing protein TSR4
MPNLINVFSSKKDNDDTGMHKKKISTEQVSNSDGMEWGTCMIFTCERDCSNDSKEGWMEEIVLVQWDQ